MKKRKRAAEALLKIIAELGINHLGKDALAKEMIARAHDSGVWGVKFQYRNMERAYSSGSSEIGDEILQENIARGALSVSSIRSLAEFATQLGLKVGISFFNDNDVSDFRPAEFDFYKVPSAELNNHVLIRKLVATRKEVLVSTGMHTEPEIERLALEFSEASNLVLLHCVSNYPVRPENSNLGYLGWLKDKFSFRVGYSSHDSEWELCLIALAYEIEYLERHVTLDKSLPGTDQSSSSTFVELSRLAEISRHFHSPGLGRGPRTLNQGEKINRQNLGRSFYAKRDLSAGEEVIPSDFNYLSPQVGLDASAFTGHQSLMITDAISRGGVLSPEHLGEQELLPTASELYWARSNGVSLPVRLHDLARVRSVLPVGSFEFHLSYGEVENLDAFSDFLPKERYSIHLPDYCSPDRLLNPFSGELHVAQKSADIIRKVSAFARRLSEATQAQVVVVSSLSDCSMPREEFFRHVGGLFDEASSENVVFSLQWLPPFAWYFGGSIKLFRMNSVDDIPPLVRQNIPVTMDTSHLMMGVNAGMYSVDDVLKPLEKNIVHLHLSGADGVDGEGSDLAEGSVAQNQLISGIFTDSRFQPLNKVIEVWQGHLHNFSGFRKAICGLSRVVSLG